MSGLRLTAPVVVALLAVFMAGAAIAQPERKIPVPVRPSADFGRDVTLDKRSFVYVTGHADFDDVYNALIAALKKVRGYLDKEGIVPAGPPLARYTDAVKAGFSSKPDTR